MNPVPRNGWWDNGYRLFESIDSWDHPMKRRRVREPGIEVTVRPMASSEPRFEVAASLAPPSGVPVVQPVAEDLYPARSGSPEWGSHMPHRSPGVHNTHSGPCEGIAGGSPQRSRTDRPA